MQDQIVSDPKPVSLARRGDVAKLRQNLDDTLVALRVERYSWWTHWRDLAENILPRRYHWLVIPNQASRGSPINQHIIDSTGTLAMRVLASGLMAGVTSPARPWFRLTIPGLTVDEGSPVKQWLDIVQERMLFVFANSNYYSAKAQQYQDLGTFGTAPIIIYEDAKEIIRCFGPCAGEYYAAISPSLRVDTLYREMTMTVRQVVTEFGEDNVSDSVRGAFKSGGAQAQKEIIVCHAIEPNDDRLGSGLIPNRFPWREVYWEWGQGRQLVLRARGFYEQPFSCPRWDVAANDAYGRSPGMDALGDIRQLQLEQKRKAQAIDKMVNPPMVGDVELKNQPASTLPGGVTYVTSTGANAGFRPAFEVNPRIAEMMEDIKEVQERINRVFFADLFLMISQLDTVRTATEIDARKEEKLIQLGPVLERFQNESLDPEIDRVFAIMCRRGLIPPPPKEIQGRPIKVVYESMLAQAQRAASTTAIERLAAFVGNVAGADPQILDTVDWDEAVDEYAEKLGVPPKVIRSAAALAQMRQQRQQQAAQQQAMQASLAGVQGAQVLSKTDVGGGQNALAAMLGNGPSPQGVAA